MSMELFTKLMTMLQSFQTLPINDEDVNAFYHAFNKDSCDPIKICWGLQSIVNWFGGVKTVPNAGFLFRGIMIKLLSGLQTNGGASKQPKKDTPKKEKPKTKLPKPQPRLVLGRQQLEPVIGSVLGEITNKALETEEDTARYTDAACTLLTGLIHLGSLIFGNKSWGDLENVAKELPDYLPNHDDFTMNYLGRMSAMWKDKSEEFWRQAQ